MNEEMKRVVAERMYWNLLRMDRALAAWTSSLDDDETDDDYAYDVEHCKYSY